MFLEEIQKITPDFPSEYLMFPPYDIETQNFRRETAEEIYGSSAVFDDLQKVVTELYVLKKYRRDMNDIKNKDARNHCFLCAVAKYCAVLRHLAEITKNTHSRGLRGLYNSVKTLLCEIENNVYRKMELLSARLNEMLAVSLSFDFSNQTLKIGAEEKNSASEKLSELASSILGAKLAFSFSVVNNIQLSPLE